MKFKIIHSIALLCLLIFVSACTKSKNQETVANETRIDRQGEEDFELFYKQFIEDFNLKNTRYLNRYIDIDNGLIIIATEGAYSLPHQFTAFANFMEYKGEGEINYMRGAKITKPIKYGAKPVFDCTKQLWSQDGCFWNDKPNPQFSQLYDVLMEHHILAHDQTIEEKIKTADALATRIVYSTENNMGFYFNRMNSKWYLLCIERILPCGK